MTAEPQRHRSAGFQPAVSQFLNLLTGRTCQRTFELGYRQNTACLPIKNRRYSRLKTCATVHA